ncbi:MAG: 5-bromo-4-chloroindolyl phosphate hydrolysis family protein [Oscillospiraceae bacterium]|nr:5-bromo-4-chloroindolyl phosphate hydrolysis family protein [Oscillospiraceae bacterium]
MGWFLLRGVVISALVLFAGKRIWKNQVTEASEAGPEQQAEEQAPKSTGNPKVDQLMQERDRAISEMRRLNQNILDPTISRQIDEVEEVTEKIFDHVAAHPEKLPQIRKFLNYYLPTTLKLLNAYDRMGAQGVSGENIDSAMKKVEEMMEHIVVAFRRQLDELFGAEAMDIKSDIQVLENMMIREGLLDTPLYYSDEE